MGVDGSRLDSAVVRIKLEQAEPAVAAIDQTLRIVEHFMDAVAIPFKLSSMTFKVSSSTGRIGAVRF